MIRVWIFLWAFFLLSTGHAQTLLPDSIENRFKDLPRDSTYIIELNKLANVVMKNNPELARKIATHVTELAPEIKFGKGYARALVLIGNSYWYEGVFEFAQNYFLLAARQYQSIGDSIGLGQTYNNVAEVYKKMQDYEKALEYLNLSVQLKRKDNATRALTLYNIGEVYVFINNLSKASEFIDEALLFAIKNNDNKVIGYCYNGLGIIHSKQKKYNQAIDYFLKAEKKWKEIGEIRLLIQTYQELADVYRYLKQFEKAEQYLSLSAEMSNLIKVPDLLVTNFLKYAKLDSARGRYDRALGNMQRYTTLKDSMYNLAKSEQIARLQMVFESETKTRENQQLRAEQELRETQLEQQWLIIYIISAGLLLTGVMAWFLYLQRHKFSSLSKTLQEKNDEIGNQKLAIEMQATALIKLNEELQELNKNLESRIDERTKQLTIQNQRLTEYTFVNAHKLRAPVSSILGLINLVDEHKPEELKTILAHLKTCGNQLDVVTREISTNLEGGIIDHDK
jgi:tetratricopeptide (TPR) repeat protein